MATVLNALLRDASDVGTCLLKNLRLRVGVDAERELRRKNFEEGLCQALALHIATKM